MTKMRKYLIINADDFGLSPSVNQGILESYRASIVSSATLMTNMPGFEDAVQMAKAEPGLGVGLHLNLSYGRPLTDASRVPSLVKEDGTFVYHPDDTTVPWTADDVRTELTAQWQRFLSTGLTPTHIDSHHLVHALEPAFSVVVEFCQEHELPLRKTEPIPTAGLMHPPTTDALVVDDYFRGDGKTRMISHLSEVTEGVTEILCHPGYVDDHVRAISPWTDVREVELAVFTDPELAAAMAEAGIVRTHFGKLASL